MAKISGKGNTDVVVAIVRIPIVKLHTIRLQITGIRQPISRRTAAPFCIIPSEATALCFSKPKGKRKKSRLYKNARVPKTSFVLR